jgi:hypothetical protein
MVVRENYMGSLKVGEAGTLGKFFKKAADKGKRAIGIRRRLGNVSLNATEIARSGLTPVLFFINRKSGGNIGELLLDSLKDLVNDIQICDVLSSKPEEYLSLFSACGKNLRVVCCGGDGTVSW